MQTHTNKIQTIQNFDAYIYIVGHIEILFQDVIPINPIQTNRILKSRDTGVVPMHAVTYIGYWAYGSSASSYLLNNVSGPIWLKGMANIAAFLQAIIALHIFASPTYEFLDTKYGVKGSALACKNLAFRIIVRGGYIAITAFLSALLPFLGDFMSLTGAISTFPLTFILPNHMYIVAKRKKLSFLQKSWHWLNIFFFSCISVAALVAALKLITVDSKTYHVFADL